MPRPPQEAASTAVAQAFDPGRLPPSVAANLWRGDSFGVVVAPVLASGFGPLDAELPGGGWPCRALTELLQPQPSVAEWRLLGPALGRVAATRRSIALVGPPKPPHAPGLRHVGIDPHRLLWLRADTPAERLWCTEQLVRSNACGALVAWLPQARPEQIRRLQVSAQGCEGPVFVCRPAAAVHEASAAPLRVHVTLGLDWHLHVRVVKRRGPVHDGVIRLHSVPGGLDAVLTPRLQRPTSLTSSPLETADAVDRPTARHDDAVRHAVAH